METHPKTSLNDLLRHWRIEMSQYLAFQQTDLDELESHLRDATETWKAKGLNDEEAFLIASRRLGYSDRLAIEYQKANPERRLLNPAAWMLAGGLLFSIVGSLLSFANTATAVIISSFMAAISVNPTTSNVVALSVTFTTILIIGSSYWLVRRGSCKEEALVSRLLQRPLTFILLIVLLFLVNNSLRIGFIGLAKTLSPSDYSRILVSIQWPLMLGAILFPLLLSYALYRRATSRTEEQKA